MPKPLKSTATTTGEAQPRWPAIKLKKGLILESVLEDQIYVIDVSPPPAFPFIPSLPFLQRADLILIFVLVISHLTYLVVINRTYSLKKNAKLSSDSGRR